MEGRRGVCAGGKDVVHLLLGGGVVLGEVDGEARVGESCVLAGGCGQVDADPSGEITVVAGYGFDRDGTQGMEGLGVLGGDGCAFLDDVEGDDGLPVGWVSTRIVSKTRVG